MLLTHAIVIFAAAFVAGMMNAIAGGGTLITFPALIWIGLDPKVANATSTVALWPGLLSGAWGYRSEIGNSRTLLWRLGSTSVVGGGVGAWLLIVTPTETFSQLVPFLILFATVLFIVQEPISRRLRSQATAQSAELATQHAIESERPTTGWWWVGVILFQFVSATYGGYFGAGNGIVMLAVLGIIGISNIHQANGIKNFLGVCLNSVAVIIFVFSGLVYWPEAALMTVSAIGGGYGGARVAQRLGRLFVRRAVISIGLIIGFVMLWRLRG